MVDVTWEHFYPQALKNNGFQNFWNFSVKYVWQGLFLVKLPEFNIAWKDILERPCVTPSQQLPVQSYH